PGRPGVGGVREGRVTGARDEVVPLAPDLGKMGLAGVSAAQTPGALRASGTGSPAGALVEDGTSLPVQVGARLESVKDLENLYLTPAAPQPQAQSPQQPNPQQAAQQQAMQRQQIGRAHV